VKLEVWLPCSGWVSLPSCGDAAVLKLWARRHRDLSRARNRIVCRLHAVLSELVHGGFPKEISAAQADQALADVVPPSASC
jgi:hypothetical protein